MTEEPGTSAPAGPTERREERPGLPVGVIAGAVFCAVVLAGLFLLIRMQSDPPGPPPIAPEVEAYLPHLAVGELRLSAEENFLGQQVVYLDGQIANRGDRIVRQLSVRVYFRDSLNQIILRDDRDVVRTERPGAAPLAPGEMREFRLLFDHIPESWNRQLPQFQLVSMELE
ncbi:MAG: DUF2393 family protein [Terriglobia bacterium]